MTAPELEHTDAATVDALVQSASAAADTWAATARESRAGALVAVADALDAAADTLIPVAERETHLTRARLAGELTRTTFQLRLFAEVLAEGAYLDVRIDHADPDWPMGAPRPDLRRTSVPLGPVVVFAASNFPFAFSVAGGDTASALAAGCPVILKAHSGHPGLSALTGEVVTAALRTAGAPDGLFAVIYGVEAGRQALGHPLVKAGSFTGSIAGGRALFDLAAGRSEPIPFFGELGSVNPVFVTQAAATSRGAAVAEDFIASFTLGAGQFCTKPGVLLVPEDSTMVKDLREAALPAAAPLLNDRIEDGFRHELARLQAHRDVEVLSHVPERATGAPNPTLLTTTAGALLADTEALFAECFGPAALVVTYREEEDLLRVAEAIDGQLTATVVGEEDDTVVADLLPILVNKAGRLLWNQWPTGVSVTYAQQHGGPFPATTAPSSTSVGTAAITRFLRPVAFQGFPENLLPVELRSQLQETPRRVNGQLGFRLSRPA